jgi:hypothetical protein
MTGQRLKSRRANRTGERLIPAADVVLAGDQAFKTFVREMNALPYLQAVQQDQRAALMKELYRLANYKRAIDRWAETEREEEPKFREYRAGLADVERVLSQALQKITEVVSIYPREDIIEMLIGGEDIRFTTLQAAKALGKAIKFAAGKQKLLAAMVNPELRTDFERELVPQETFAHWRLPLGEKTPAINHWFIGEAASKLDDYCTQDGRRIKRYDKIIAKVFNVALDDKMRTDESIRIELRRQKKDGQPELF